MTLRAGGLMIVALIVARAACAQDDAPPVPAAEASAAASQNSWFLRAGYSPAHVLAASPFGTGSNEARTLTLELGRQTDGTRPWHRVYNYPSYGVGVYVGRFDHERELGRPIATYGFFSWPFPVSRVVHVVADVGIGVSWNWTAFDPVTNSTNTALGSAVAYHIDSGVSLRFLVNQRASVYAGLNLTHWSNGATSQPNLGLAVVGPKLGVRYNFAPQVARSRAAAADLPRFDPVWEFVVGGAGSGKTAVAATNSHLDVVDLWRDFGAFNITTGMQRHFYRFGKVAGGADVTYDGATGARVDIRDGRQVESRAPIDQRFALGLYGGYEHVIARFSVLVQLGYTVWPGIDDVEVPRFYQRYGSRFYFSERFWGTFAVRTIKIRKANFVEFGLGYRVRWPAHVKLTASSTLPDPL
jgi:lipid A 3-O-deacylase PagL